MTMIKVVVGNKIDKIAIYYCTILKLYHSTCSWHSVRKFCTVDVKERKSASKMGSKRQALLLSSSNCHGYPFLEFAKNDICSFLGKKQIKELVFVPYAQNDYHGYTAKIKGAIEKWGINVNGIHTYPDPRSAIDSAKAIFIGGGNTFLLLKRLYEHNLVNLIREKVHSGDLLYIGSSAGTNVATKSIHTTNDMPIAYPPTFDAIGIVPFNINPHYIDFLESETHKGETRDQRIGEYLEMDYAAPVLGLKEGSIFYVNGNSLSIQGVNGAVLFLKDQRTEYPSGTDVSFVLILAEGDGHLVS